MINKISFISYSVFDLQRSIAFYRDLLGLKLLLNNDNWAEFNVDGQRLAILPAVYGIDDLRQAIASYDTIVLMKVNRTLLEALANLEKLGLAGKGIYVRRASTAREQVVRDLQQLSEENLDYFSLLIIRK